MLACSNREQVAEAAANALEGFGLVTLASLMPVLTVELLAIGLKWMYTHEDIISMKPPPIDHNSLLERAPFREIYFAVRAILPLCAALVALVVLVLRSLSQSSLTTSKTLLLLLRPQQKRFLEAILWMALGQWISLLPRRK